MKKNNGSKLVKCVLCVGKLYYNIGDDANIFIDMYIHVGIESFISYLYPYKIL